MVANTKHHGRRPAAALIETAAVMIVFIMSLFAVLEYGRFFFVRELVSNAAREGARYAVVHTYDASVENDTRAQILARLCKMEKKLRNFTMQLYHADANGNRVTGFDPSAKSNYAYFNDAKGVYLLDGGNTKIYTANDTTGSFVLNSSNQKVYLNLDPFTSTVTGANAGLFSSYVASKKIQNVDSIANAAFGQYLAVELSCDYDPITPAMLRLGKTITVRTKVLMYSEAN